MFHFRDVSADTDFATFKAHQLADPDECDGRTDSDRYAELRKLVEDTQREAMDPASPLVVFDNALRLLLDWRHR